jgi:two-component system, NarL family, response regulator DevR
MTFELQERAGGPSGEGLSLASMERIRLLLVDDHPAVRRGLLELMQDEPDFLVVATVSSADEALSLAQCSTVDVVVTDYQLGRRSGLWLSRKLKRLPRPPRVVIYTAYSDGLLAAAAAVAEADGMMSKGSLGSELSRAIRAVARGRLLLPMVRGQFAEEIRARLDDQEQAIYGMRLAGISTAEIARTLGISAGGLESRLSEMLGKLEAPERPARRLPERSMLG